jgi:hypothetical protein
MSRSRGWITGAALAIVVAAAVFAGQQHQDSPEHSSSSDAVNGTSAALLFAGAMGHPTDQVGGTFSPPATSGLMFVFTPTSAFSSDEADTTAGWVRSGGVLVYASEHGDPELDRALGVNRLSGVVAAAKVDVAGPMLQGVSQVAGGAFASPFTTGSDQVAILRSGSFPVAYMQKLGSGRVVVLADPLELCNGYLEKADNGRLLADLLGLAAAGGPVVFDEYHHGLTAADLTPQAWILTPWGAALLWVVVAVFLGLYLRGRRFGPLMPRQGQAERAEAEWAVAVGALLRRTGARAVTLGVLANATERAVAARTGLSLQPRERFWSALWRRAPDVAGALDGAERALYSSANSEKDLLQAAKRLHQVAYPVSEEHRRPRPQ